jgi:acetylornithine deacetylase/succinyl-diaminopimelate desuccinylase-like protein
VAELEPEVTRLARELVRIDTSNPPGNETPAAEHLAAYLEAAGAECELAGPDPERLNLIARVRGGDGPSLLFMAHTDVVPAPPDGWSVDPFAGEIADGHLIGRGAADMKSELAARAVALAELARSGEPPAGDVVLVAQADEERNQSGVGMSWLVRERRDARCDLALDEGGGSLLELDDGSRIVTVAVGEKLVTSLRLRVRGTGGHASIPSADNPVGKAAVAAERLLAHEPPPRILPAVARALEVLGADPAGGSAAIAAAASRHPWLADHIPPMTRMTVVPTGLEAGEPANVIPGHADVICDCRPLPGDTEEGVRAHVAAALGDDIDYELEFLEPLEGGTESPIDTPLYAAIEEYVADRAGAAALPILSLGFADSAFVRAEWGTAAYGFAPVFATDLGDYNRGIHAIDEKIAVADLVEMAEFHLRAARAL